MGVSTRARRRRTRSLQRGRPRDRRFVYPRLLSGPLSVDASGIGNGLDRGAEVRNPDAEARGNAMGLCEITGRKSRGTNGISAPDVRCIPTVPTDTARAVYRIGRQIFPG